MNRKERRRARKDEARRLSGYDAKTGAYLKGGLALPNVRPPRMQDAPPEHSGGLSLPPKEPHA